MQLVGSLSVTNHIFMLMLITVLLTTCSHWLDRPIQRLQRIRWSCYSNSSQRRLTLSAHGALPASRVLLNPLHDAVLVKKRVSKCLCCLGERGDSLRRWKSLPCENCGHICQTLQMHLRKGDGMLGRMLPPFALKRGLRGERDSRNLQSSPGYLHVGQVPSK